VSPELALVDDELATRLRSVTAAPVRASSPLAERSFVWHVEPRRSSHARRRLVALAVPAIVAALAVVLHDVSTTDGPTTETARPLVSATTSDVGAKPSRPAPRHATTPTPKPKAVVPKSRIEATPATTTPSRPNANDAGVPKAPAPRTTKLFWTRAAGVTSYELVLVRNGRRILGRISSTPEVEIPRAWTRAGQRYGIRPEDQAYVWALVDGRRSGRPLVDGAPALDLMLGGTFPS